MTEVESTRSLGDYARIVRRRWVYLVTIIPGALLLSIFTAYVLPASYRSTGVIMIEPSSISSQVVQSTVSDLSAAGKDVSAFVDQQLDVVRRRVLNVTEMKSVVETLDPYPQEKGLSTSEKAKLVVDGTAIERVDPLTLEPSATSAAFAISYDNPEPALAKEMAGKIVDLFVTFNRRTRAEQAKATYDFLQQQAKLLEVSMQEMEGKLALFKSKYGAALPEAQTRNFASIDRLQRDVESLDREIRIAQEKESLLTLQLNGISPSITASVGDWRTQLATMRAELALAQQKYTPEHPDVKRLQRAIADLAAQGAAAGTASARPDNPEYLMVQSQLTAARRDLEGLRATGARSRSEMMQLEQQIGMSPNVESQYTQLAREYQNTVGQYQDLQSKIKAAALAQNFEGEARGERFTMVRPPFTPSSPFFPNRLGIILIGIVLGSALAFGWAALAEASDPTVRGADDLQEIMNVTPIGAVPRILNAADLRRRRMTWGTAAAGFAVAAVIVAATVAVAS